MKIVYGKDKRRKEGSFIGFVGSMIKLRSKMAKIKRNIKSMFKKSMFFL